MVSMGIGAGVFMLFAPFILSDPKGSPPPTLASKIVELLLFWGVAAFYTCGTGRLALHLRDEIIADENGLRWRDIRSWKSATWPQVSDYYQSEIRHRKIFIEANNEKFEYDFASMTNVAELSAAIEQHSTNARTSQWEVLGLRPELDWPRDFQYHPEKHLRPSIIPGIVGATWVLGLSYGFWNIRNTFLEVWEYSGPAFALLGVLLFALLIYAGVGMASLEISTRRETKARRAQKITVNKAGLIYDDGANRIQCAWGEIRDYYRDPMAYWSSSDDRFVIIAPSGEFDFTIIEDRFLLKKIISDQATNAAYKHWREYVPKHEVLAAQGERVFNYRTRENRALILPAMIAIPITIWMAFVIPNANSSSQNQMNDAGARFMLLCMAFVLTFICRRYFVGEIRITDKGIAQRDILGRKFLAWSEIKQLQRGSFAYQVIGKNQRIAFGSSIADKKHLCEEIALRATNAEVVPSWTQASTRTGT